MAKANSSVKLQMSASETLSSLQKVIREFKWDVLELGTSQVVVKVVQASSLHPYKLRIEINPINESTTELHIFGTMNAIGPGRTIAALIGKLINALSVDAQEFAKNGKGGFVDELTKLASLLEKGLITQEEFSQAKIKLLG